MKYLKITKQQVYRWGLNSIFVCILMTGKSCVIMELQHVDCKGPAQRGERFSMDTSYLFTPDFYGYNITLTQPFVYNLSVLELEHHMLVFTIFTS